MSSPLTLRLDERTRRRLRQVARRRRLSTSQVVRHAIDAFMEREEATTRPYDLVADLIGVVHGADPALSSHTGRKFTELLKKRRSRS